jgi:hypothetical protein
MDATTKVSSVVILERIGNACAMNNKKNGALTHLSLRNAISLQTGSNLSRFFNSFKVSEQQHERWYGEEKVAKDMKLE